MHLDIDTLIIGGGYAGLLAQKRCDIKNITSFILDKGDAIRFADKDYVILCHDKMMYTADDPIKLTTESISSGSDIFTAEYARKLYNKEVDVKLFHKQLKESEVYQINNRKLLEKSKVYGNIEVTKIDIVNRIVTGKVLHMGKSITVNYLRLISTIPLYEFAKLSGINLLSDNGIFISFFPIGIMKRRLREPREDMHLTYYSDPLVPFYRKHKYGSSIFYEYCLNKPFSDMKFTRIITPGKFIKLDDHIMNEFYENMRFYDVYFAGRFATWDPDFLISDVFVKSDKSISTKALSEAFK